MTERFSLVWKIPPSGLDLNYFLSVLNTSLQLEDEGEEGQVPEGEGEAMRRADQGGHEVALPEHSF